MIGGGVAGLKAALELAERGLAVVLVEKSPFLGGQVAQLQRLAPSGETAAEVISELAGAVLQHPAITVHTCARVEDFAGYIGNFKLKVVRQPPEGEDYAEPAGQAEPVRPGPGGICALRGGYAGGHSRRPEEFDLEAGVIVLATGFRPYRPRAGGIRLRGISRGGDPAGVHPPDGRSRGPATPWCSTAGPSAGLALIHCVGSRQIPGIHEENEGGYLNEYCSRTCCSATL